MRPLRSLMLINNKCVCEIYWMPDWLQGETHPSFQRFFGDPADPFIFLIMFCGYMGSSHLISCLKVFAFICNPEVSSEFNSMLEQALRSFVDVIDSEHLKMWI